MANVRKIAYDVLYRVFRDNAYSALALNSAIKDNSLSKLDASLTSALVYGVLERTILLDYVISQYSDIPIKKIDFKTLLILRLGVYQMIFMDKIPDSAAVNESVKLSKKLSLFRSSGFINAVLRNISRNNHSYQLPSENNTVEHLSVRYSCPRHLVQMWISSYGYDNTVSILKSLSGRPPLTIRVNTIKTTKQKLKEDLSLQGVVTSDVPFLSDALNIENTGSLEHLQAFKNGDFYVQDAASQICAEILDAKPGMTVCDVCSAPGGKTFASAIKMKNQGNVYSYDIHKHKISLISQTADRLGISIIKPGIRDAADKSAELPDCDRLLCDVPCSGFGIIRRKPEIRYKKDTNIDNLSNLQYIILCNNAEKISTGGIVVYSTCTLNDSENRKVVDLFLAKHPDFEPVPVKLPNGVTRFIDEPEHMLTLLPFNTNTDGFFVSCFKKVGSK